ncbi:MAG: chromosome partitioning protein ParA [Lysobacterales bacterium CG17_big_fil_post_rev_8_21_14_2_50_64_11]|nr:MAG: chromosome partitioning protein ParA [Xanthomonadales bacterium CG17_big_fil_post_rev_8_21_14_2_50_64_11]PIX59567.1 MAG: DUF1365 domain-containing protein [Xanthomonadales bacterium CG_4_10_14_3_um_filter_64_11]
MHSAIYEGRVSHRRQHPVAHAFSYRVFMLWLDLAELDTVFARRWLWSINRRNLAAFHRADYHGSAGLALDQAVRDTVHKALGTRPDGPIRLLTHLRYFGLCFNPVSFYYGYDATGETLQWVMAEITNTPWRERHAYVLPVAAAAPAGDWLLWEFDKCFHVSPFMAMDRRYRWRLTAADQRLHIHMSVLDGAQREFDATLILRRRPLAAGVMAWMLLRYPAITAKIVAAIHWQALRLWLKRVPVHDHPRTAVRRQNR